MDKPIYIEAYVYGLEKMLEEARQTIARLSKELDAMNKEQAALRESKQGVEKRLGEGGQAYDCGLCSSSGGCGTGAFRAAGGGLAYGSFG